MLLINWEVLVVSGHSYPDSNSNKVPMKSVLVAAVLASVIAVISCQTPLTSADIECIRRLSAQNNNNYANTIVRNCPSANVISMDVSFA